MENTTDYPDGDGLPDCPHCKGRGVVLVPKEELPPYALPGTTRFCVCVRKRDLWDNLKRGWAPLTKVPKSELVKTSPLVGHTNENMWIRCSDKTLRAHLRAAAVRRSPNWRFKVVSDADLLTTWLYSANEVLDPDVGLARARGRNTASRICDLVEPYDLTIIRTGVKTARNQAAAEVFLEALMSREHLDQPTWVIDSPERPLRQGHLMWDEDVQRHLSDYYTFVEIGGGSGVNVPAPSRPFVPMGMSEETEGEDSKGSILSDDGRVGIRKRDWRNQ